jgi:hypothetical protein
MRLLLEQSRKDRARIAALEREVRELRAVFGLDRASPLRLPKARAKRMIRRFFAERHGETLYPDDVAEAMNLDLSQTIELCRELAVDGAIAEKR